MDFKQWIFSILLSHHLAFAYACPHYEQLQVPQCLATQILIPHQVLAENKAFKIIEMCSTELNQLSHLADSLGCGRFLNVSSHFLHLKAQTKSQEAQELLNAHKALVVTTKNYKIYHQEQVNAFLKKISKDAIRQTLLHVTSFYNRSATQDTGVAAANWLKAQFEQMALTYGRTDTDTFFVSTGWYKQPSLVAVIGKQLKEPAIVIGAHIDTLDEYMPGADDDASGTASVLEVARVLLASKITFQKPVYIIWYAAEERGLVGSQYVVKHFIKEHIPVEAVLQLDMTGYRPNPKDPSLWIFLDYTNLDLSHFLVTLADTYLQIPAHFSRCGYACSDHASWTAAGIPAVFPCESSFENHNSSIHTASDTMDWLSLEHMANFSKLALAFVMELAM